MPPRARPEPAPAPTPPARGPARDDIYGVLNELQRLNIVITGMQRDLGDVVTDTAVLKQIITEGEGGRLPLLARTAVVEQQVTAMSGQMQDHRRAVESQINDLTRNLGEHRERLEGLLNNIRDTMEKRQQQAVVTILSLATTIIVAAASTIVALLSHMPK